MFAHASVLSLVFLFFISQANCYIDLDTRSTDSLKSTAKTLAGSIISLYNDTLQDFGAVGLFPEDDYYFWEAGTVWNALIGYSYFTGDLQYDALVSQALQSQLGDYGAFMPLNQTKTLGNDDQSCWGLAAMTAAEVGFPKSTNASWVDYAINVWNTQALRLDNEEASGVCGGGLRWQIFTFNTGYNYKDSLSNGNFFLLSARLAKFTGNVTYSHYADKVFKWSRDIKLISDNYQVYAGAYTGSQCSNVSSVTYTANHGVYAEGAALMHNITGSQNWTDAVNGLVKASSVFQDSKAGYALVEVSCENSGNCDIDQRAFKGIFARSMARAAQAAPIVSDIIKKMLSTNAKAAANACTAGTDNADAECNFAWANTTSNWDQASAKDGNLGEVYNALEIVQGMLYPSVKALKMADGVQTGISAGNGTSGTAGGNSPQQTGAAGVITSRVTMILGGLLVAAFFF